MNDKIVQCMAQAFGVDPDQINENSSQDTIDNWDSIHHVRMIVLLEKAFRISIPDERVGNMISYKLIESAVNECKQS